MRALVVRTLVRTPFGGYSQFCSQKFASTRHPVEKEGDMPARVVRGFVRFQSRKTNEQGGADKHPCSFREFALRVTDATDGRM